MSYHYNEAFENPDYHFSETLEIDRRRSSQKNLSSHQTSYDSSLHGSYGEHSGRGQNYPVAIPMTSMRHGSEYSRDLPRVNVLSRSQYENSTDNFSFEPEPELAYSLPSTFHLLDRPYPHGFSNVSEGFIQRHNRRPSDEISVTSSSLFEMDPVCREEKDLVGNLASMSTSERIKAIQKMPETMKKKREIRNKVLKEITKKTRHHSTRLSRCTQCLQGTAVLFRRFGNSLSEYSHLLQLWHKTLKIIGAKFGTSVLSYFIFLKWLLTFNMFSFLINFSFITIPQFFAAEPNNLSFTGLELFTGAGYFQQTVLYYGFYTNSTISKIENGPPYNMQLAYIFTVGIYFVICFLILLFSMAKSFCRNFINPQTYSGNASKLLCTWDFNITNEKAVKLKQKNLSTQIKEGLTEVNQEVLYFSVTERVERIVIHLVSWVASLGTAVAACAGVYFLSINNLKLFVKGHKNDLEGQAAMLVLPVVASLLNAFIPFFYSWLGHLERFQTPGYQIYIAITRNIILKISIVGILCYYWLNIVATSESQCWETLVGQDIYRLVLVDFAFCLLGSFFGEFLRRIITYLYWQIIEGRKTMTKLLRKQIINEGKDKIFLLEVLRVLQRANQITSVARGQGQQSSSSFQLHRQPGQLVPGYPTRAPERHENAPYGEYPRAAGILRGTGFPLGKQQMLNTESSSEKLSSAKMFGVGQRQYVRAWCKRHRILASCIKTKQKGWVSGINIFCRMCILVACAVGGGSEG
ncbi:transmembrane channel-like protein 5 isoform X5 [Falco rusticolus]|uniref:transmembrane channel-like protein 5 isoform X5 n=1 Tax=Falco rusticolus TaxID=120794 RepID=UPI001886A759|nr:transmembrane channel-like protein 5 isoform X5 [Falco rusticolus]